VLFRSGEREEESRQPTFETVTSPYGQGGFGQRNKLTGQITGYQAANVADISDYQRDVADGYTGTIDEWYVMKRAPTVSVYTGDQGIPKPPAGYMYAQNPDGTTARDADGLPTLVTIPGGQAEQSEVQQVEQEEKTEGLELTAASIITQDLERALIMIDESPVLATGLIGGATEWIGGLPADNLQEMLLGAQAHIGFERLQQMRDASKTGGALGQVSTIELDLLKSAFGALSITQDAKDLKFNIMRFSNILNDTVHGRNNGGTVRLTHGK
jgi:hypothetical protein